MTGRASHRRAGPRTLLGRSGFLLLVVLVLLFTLFPFYWAVNASLLPQAKLFATPAVYVPVPPTVEWYEKVWKDTGFVRALRNSGIVAVSTTVLALSAGAMAAYALARFRMRGRRITLGLILAMTMFPQISVLGAMHQTITALGLYNRLGGLVLSYMILTLPLTVWVMSGFFGSLPRELEESAYVDGASPFQTFWRIMLPLAVPGLAATGLLAFIAAWNEYLFAQSFTITENTRTVPVVIANFTGATIHETPWGTIMAACVVVTVPLVILVLIFQKQIVDGLTSGAVKE
ncbi:MAG: carbohydrate ABC transporter permease [Candidatus Sumerlaeaceae bacterium]